MPKGLLEGPCPPQDRLDGGVHLGGFTLAVVGAIVLRRGGQVGGGLSGGKMIRGGFRPHLEKRRRSLLLKKPFLIETDLFP